MNELAMASMETDVFFNLKKWSPGFLKVFQSVSVDIQLFFYLTTFKRMIFVCQAT